MAQQALHPGTTQTRGRAFFGLLDGSGWGWASLKAVFWFILLIFMLGYIPDRAYYFTVNKTIDLGILAWSPLNFCPEGNRTLPCPAPAGAVVPWEVSPPNLSLPAVRTDGAIVQSGTTILYVGGSDGTTPTDQTFMTKASGVGNFDPAGWTAGPKLPEPRSNLSVIYAGGKIYAIGGIGPDGKATTSVYVLTPDSKTGALGEWQTAADAKLDLELPGPRAGAAVVAAPDGLILVGGTDGAAPLNTVLKTTFETKTGAPGKWATETGTLFTPVTDASAALVGNYLWVYGGTGADGAAVATVQRGEFGTGADATKVVRFGIKGGATDLPAARTDLAGFAANGSLYAIGGSDGTAPQSTLYWAIPTNSGDITDWKHLDVSDLPTGVVGAAPMILGPDAILVGGKTPGGVIAASNRANIAPEAPFFQVGLVGATVPALKIDGEIGQQLGYLNANTVGIADFTLFVIIGWAFAHKDQLREWRERRRRERELKRRA
jgi:hypothetical protein